MQRIWLLALFVVCFQLWTRGQTQDLTKTFCDDQDVEAAVDLALVSHNEKLQQGNQLALYQIETALKGTNESGTLFIVNFMVRESDCPVGGDKVWRDCDYLPQGNTMPSPCTAKVYRSNLEGSPLILESVGCTPKAVEPVATRERFPCLGCPVEIDVENEDLREPLMYALAKLNAEDNSSHHFLLHEIISATRQVVAGFRYDIRFEIRKSNCSKSDFKELTEDCHPTDENPEFANCSSTIYIAPWRREDPEAHVNCEPSRDIGMVFVRRRPPGWSPLRHFNNNFAAVKAPPTSNPASTPNPNPTTKEESSEESQEATQPPAESGTDGPQVTKDPALLLELPTAAPAPFNCPSKPWKEFIPVTTPSPTRQSPPPPVSPQGDGLFSDFDLLG
ncbi:hypothetical protein JZ751_025059 [Albula glossodonta]|uniref:Cystatin kininogen-type domain-containing protein n=1 Tax=Albula glossodonta TaxID=121402 RepID=A0A8T2PG84_9TELE|nr:hypothetical protein JZ751_025059 [Albula glossodonta]